MKALSSLLVLLVSLSVNAQDLQTANYVDIERYVGKWYSLKSLPQFFTRNCQAQSADYAVVDKDTISVLNTCFKKKGKSTIKGEASVKNYQTNAELIVTFDSFFTRLFNVKGDYNIIKLDQDYRYVLIGSKDRKSLWLMAREKTMPEDVKNEYLNIAKEQGFDITKLEDSKF